MRKTTGWLRRVDNYFERGLSVLCRKAVRTIWDVPDDATEIRVAIVRHKTAWSVAVNVVFVRLGEDYVKIVVAEKCFRVVGDLLDALARYGGRTIYVECEYR